MDRLEIKLENPNSKFERNDGKWSNLFCNYCEKPGHVIEKCYR